MKNFTLGLNVVLVLAVAVLFYLHFASPPQNNVTTNTTKTIPNGSFKIAYFESDSIQSQFVYFNEVRAESYQAAAV